MVDSFTPQATVTVGGSPQQLALSPDGTYLYVTVDNGTSPGQLYVLSAGHTPKVISKLKIGHAPRGVAVLPSGDQIFAANSADGTISVIGRAPDGTYQLGQPVTGVSSAQDVAVTNDGNVLLVTCPATNTVVAINAADPEARRPLTVGATPQHIATLPTGAYAVVTSSASNTVSLLVAGGTPAQCQVLPPGIDAGSGTTGVTVTPDASLVLLGGPAGLVVVTLAGYELSGTVPGIGSSTTGPTDVIVSPDGSTVVAWQSAFWPGGPTMTGLFCYDIASETVTARLAVTPDGRRVLATWGGNAVMIFDAASLRLVQTINCTPGEQQPTGIAITPDASQIFTANILTSSLGVISPVQGSAEATRGAGLQPPPLGPGRSGHQGLFIRAHTGQTPASGNQAGLHTDCPALAGPAAPPKKGERRHVALAENLIRAAHAACWYS